MLPLIKKHIVGFLISIVIGLIYVIPNIIFINSNHYKGLPIISTDAESWYLSRINGVYKGCLLSCNPYIKEYKSTFPFFDSSLSETILAIPGILTNTPVIKLKIFYDFLLPSILSLLVYLLIFRLTLNKWSSIFGVSFIVLGFNLLNSIDLINIPDLLDLIHLKSTYTQFLLFSRPVNPQFSSVFFFIYLHILLSAVTKRNIKWFIILALTYGLSFYIYFFTYAFITVVQGIWIGLYILKREWKNCVLFTSAILAGLMIALPQFIEIIKLFQHPYYSSIPTEYLIKTHMPDISIIGIILFLVFISITFIYMRTFKEFSVEVYFVTILILACFVARNEHVISGLIMQYNHFESYLFTPVIIISICFYLKIFNKDHSLFFISLMSLFIAIAIFNAILIQYTSYWWWLPNTKFNQQYIPVLNFLRDIIPNGSIISAPSSISRFIPLYTNNYVLWSYYAGQWIHIPGRTDDIISSRTSTRMLEDVGKKYGVDYYIEDRVSDLLKDSKKKKLFEDDNFIIYK